MTLKVVLEKMFREGMNLWPLCWLLLVLFAGAPAQAAGLCFDYGDMVRFNGVLATKEDEDLNGVMQTYWVLRLDTPACVTGDPQDRVGEAPPIPSFTEIGLIVSTEQIRRERRYMGKRITASGLLLSRDSHPAATDVLLLVKAFGR
jgi:hypothetical protein